MSNLSHYTYFVEEVLIELYLLLLCDLSGQIYLFEYENFQGRMMELSGECRNVCDKGLHRVGSIRVECGP